jgi:activator of 2-hydroxyglutaryl-CoA dehydratase
MLKVGIDIGSVSVDVVLLDDRGRIVEDRYIRHKGKPIRVAKDVLEELMATHGEKIDFVATTGTGARSSPSSWARLSPMKS